MNQPQPANHSDGLRNAVGLLVMVCRAFAISVEVFLHRTSTFGERYLGVQVLMAMALIFFWPAFCSPHHDPEPLYVFLALFACMCGCIRAQNALRRKRGGPQPHTFYTGTPIVMRFTGRMSEASVKCIEPVIVFLAGAVVCEFTPPLGGFLMISALGLLVSTQLTVGYERRRALDMNDAAIDTQQTVSRFRAMRRD
ncbi:MAG: hypothetical protein BroJett003_01750 [Planctomycetota bacterium]|nr:MAG: hypothetical protein BroJett003_01750 [Planctomycetota bacterium]